MGKSLGTTFLIGKFVRGKGARRPEQFGLVRGNWPFRLNLSGFREKRQFYEIDCEIYLAWCNWAHMKLIMAITNKLSFYLSISTSFTKTHVHCPS